jgi:hypothetical protein
MPVKPLNRGQIADMPLLEPTSTRLGDSIWRDFRPMPTKKVSADLSRDDLGLMGLTTLKLSLNNLTNWL